MQFPHLPLPSSVLPNFQYYTFQKIIKFKPIFVFVFAYCFASGIAKYPLFKNTQEPFFSLNFCKQHCDFFLRIPPPSFKGQCHEIFCVRFFSHETAPSGPISAILLPFWIFLLFHWVISILKWLCGACDTEESLRNTHNERKNSNIKKYNNIVIIIFIQFFD